MTITRHPMIYVLTVSLYRIMLTAAWMPVPSMMKNQPVINVLYTVILLKCGSR